MTNRKAEVFVLCEDVAHQSFAMGFLGKRHGAARRIRTNVAGGRGSLCDEFVLEVKRLRRYGSYTELIVVADADSDDPQDVRRILADKLASKSVPKVTDSEKVFIFCPKRCIESWAEFLNTGVIDEDKRWTKAEKRRMIKMQAKGRMLADACSTMSAGTHPPSLMDACTEWIRLKKSSK